MSTFHPPRYLPPPPLMPRCLPPQVKLREMTILDLQKKIAEGDARLKQQQNLYEAVRSDRNLYSKSLIESQAEIAEISLPAH